MHELNKKKETCDEKWAVYDNRCCSLRSFCWTEVKQQNPSSKSKRHQKIIVMLCSSETGINHNDFLNTGKSITAKKYCQKLDKLNQELLLAFVATVDF